MNRLLCTLLLALLLLAGRIIGQERFDLIVREDFFAGMFGDRARLAKGLRYCEEILRKNPRHAQALVWHGSGLVTSASFVYADGDASRGDRMWKQGIQEMNRARALAPDDMGVKIGRSALLIGMAQAGWDPTDRQARALLQSAVDDYEAVHAIQAPHFSALSEHSRCELLFGLAAGWSRLDNAAKTRDYLSRIVTACPASAYATEARAYLDQPLDQPGPTINHNCIGCHVGK